MSTSQVTNADDLIYSTATKRLKELLSKWTKLNEFYDINEIINTLQEQAVSSDDFNQMSASSQLDQVTVCNAIRLFSSQIAELKQILETGDMFITSKVIAVVN